MKIAVITRHGIINYGSLLQTIATQKAIERCGCECEIVNYIRTDEEYRNLEKTILKTKNNWNKNLFKRFIYLVLRQSESMIAGRKFSKMQSQYLNLTRRYSSLEDLQKNKPVADLYMTGSDQVWGPVADGSYDSSYFLSFTLPQDKCVAYAASFGRTEYNEKVKQNFRRWLSRYNEIAVRENSAVDLLNEIGIKSYQVLDPTLLITASEWSRIATKAPKKKYILVYQLHNNYKLNEYAKKASKELKLPLIRISPTLHQFTRSGKFKYLPDVSEFLAYIKNAECMITDSFHGTAFAINFNTQFVEILPNNKTGSRNQSILQLTGLTERIVQNTDDLHLVHEKIDYTYANEVLRREREKSEKILRELLAFGK